MREIEIKKDFTLFIKHFYKGNNKSAIYNQVKELIEMEKIEFPNYFYTNPYLKAQQSVKVFGVRDSDYKIQGGSVGEIIIDDPLKIQGKPKCVK